MPHPLWQRLATDAGTPLDVGQLDKLDRYLDALVEWNGKVNLTRIVDRASAEVRHVADALTLLRFLSGGERASARGESASFGASDPRAEARTPLTLVDVGTGGGVPGVPLAIARPDLRVTLVDATRKKLDAIDAMVAAVGVPNVATLHARAESVRQTFDVVVARAVADLATLLEWCGPLMHARSTLLALKGPRAAEEVAAVPMRVRKRFRIEVVELGLPELPGHVIVRAERAGGE